MDEDGFDDGAGDVLTSRSRQAHVLKRSSMRKYGDGQVFVETIEKLEAKTTLPANKCNYANRLCA